jgi:hypothetical protein
VCSLRVMMCARKYARAWKKWYLMCINIHRRRRR